MITPWPLYITPTKAQENKNMERHGQCSTVEKTISIRKQCKV
jgi:hypothetical protein